MCVLSTKVSIRKKSGNLFNDPRTIEPNQTNKKGRTIHQQDSINIKNIGTTRENAEDVGHVEGEAD